MGKYEVKALPNAKKELLEIEPFQRLQILNSLKVLEESPLPKGKGSIRMLKGFRPPLFRLRSGDYRIVYRIKGAAVEIMSVVNRKELERKIKRIK